MIKASTCWGKAWCGTQFWSSLWPQQLWGDTKYLESTTLPLTTELFSRTKGLIQSPSSKDWYFNDYKGQMSRSQISTYMPFKKGIAKYCANVACCKSECKCVTCKVPKGSTAANTTVAIFFIHHIKANRKLQTQANNCTENGRWSVSPTLCNAAKITIKLKRKRRKQKKTKRKKKVSGIGQDSDRNAERDLLLCKSTRLMHHGQTCI